MIDLIRRQEMVFVATADANGNCDCFPRFGTSGFVIILDDKTLAYPEYRGNGVFASLDNIIENPYIGLVFLDFFRTTVGLHVNGMAANYGNQELPLILASYLDQELPTVDSRVEQWVVITVDEAYIHCSKHVPRLKKRTKQSDGVRMTVRRSLTIISSNIGSGVSLRKPMAQKKNASPVLRITLLLYGQCARLHVVQSCGGPRKSRAA